jgi:hypothetical protein
MSGTVKTQKCQFSNTGTYDGSVESGIDGSGNWFAKDAISGSKTLAQILANLPAHSITAHSDLATDFAPQYYDQGRLLSILNDANTSFEIGISPDAGGNTSLAGHVADTSLHQGAPYAVFEVSPSGKPYTHPAAAITASLDSAYTGVKKVILIHPGEYTGAVLFLTQPDTHIVGVDRDSCIVAVNFGGYPGTVSVRADFCSVSNLTIRNDGVGSFGPCVQREVANVSEFTMSNCVLESASKDTIFFGSDNGVSQTLHVHDCIISGTFDTFTVGGNLQTTFVRNCHIIETASTNSGTFWAGGGGTHYLEGCILQGGSNAFLIDNGATVYANNILCIGHTYLYTTSASGSGTSHFYMGQVAGAPALMRRSQGAGNIVVHELDTRRVYGFELLPQKQDYADVSSFWDPDGTIKWVIAARNEDTSDVTSKSVEFGFSTDGHSATPFSHLASLKLLVDNIARIWLRDTGMIENSAVMNESDYSDNFYGGKCTATTNHDTGEVPELASWLFASPSLGGVGDLIDAAAAIFENVSGVGAGRNLSAWFKGATEFNGAATFAPTTSSSSNFSGATFGAAATHTSGAMAQLQSAVFNAPTEGGAGTVTDACAARFKAVSGVGTARNLSALFEGATEHLRSMLLDGSADEVQFTVKGHSTQTANLIEMKNDAGTVVAYLTGAGSANIKGLRRGVVSKSAAYTATLNDWMILCDATTAWTLSLPDATTCAGHEFLIVCITGGIDIVTIDPHSSQTIIIASGAGAVSTYALSELGANITVVSDGSNWIATSLVSP